MKFDWLLLWQVISLWHAMLFDSILFTIDLLSDLESILSNPSAALSTKLMQYFKSFVVTSTVARASSPGVDSISKNHFLYLYIRNTSSSIKMLSSDYSNLGTTSGSTSNSSSLANSKTSVVTFSTEVLNLLKSPMSVGINFFQTAVNVYVLTSSHESWMFLMASGMVKTFQKVFTLLCPDPSEESLSMTAIDLSIAFLIIS